jgi:hypothetical protein
MFSFFSSLRGVSGNGVETYQCAGCRGLVTHSDRLLRINASDRHFFLNPAGVECDFYTFSDCPGGFRATAGEWPSAVTAANILAGTMKRCRLSSGRENFGGFWFLI